MAEGCHERPTVRQIALMMMYRFIAYSAAPIKVPPLSATPLAPRKIIKFPLVIT